MEKEQAEWKSKKVASPTYKCQIETKISQAVDFAKEKVQELALNY